MTLWAPALNCAALGSLGAPLSIRMLPLSPIASTSASPCILPTVSLSKDM